MRHLILVAMGLLIGSVSYAGETAAEKALKEYSTISQGDAEIYGEGRYRNVVLRFNFTSKLVCDTPEVQKDEKVKRFIKGLAILTEDLAVLGRAINAQLYQEKLMSKIISLQGDITRLYTKVLFETENNKTDSFDAYCTAFRRNM